MMVRFFRIAGMIEYFLPDFFGQVRQLIILTATTSRRAATARWCVLSLPKYFELNHDFSHGPVLRGTYLFTVTMTDANGVPKMEKVN
jgi:hypothetical protein